MKLIITGSEYTGKTTLGKRVEAWIEETMGKPLIGFHDHFTFPDVAHEEMSPEEYDQIRALSPRLKSMFQNHQILYHINSSFLYDHDNLLIGFHLENAIYGPLYYGYPDDGVPETVSRVVESHIMQHAPDTIMVMLKASPDAIKSRMKDAPHPRGILQEADVDHVLQRFDEEFARSLIRYKLVIDTTTKTPNQTFAKFLTEVQPHLRQEDQMRILARKAIREMELA